MTDAKESGEKEASAAHASALEKELKANDRLHKELTETKTVAEETEEKLKKNIRELQIAIQTIEEKAGYREDNLRKDIAVSCASPILHRVQCIKSLVLTFHFRDYNNVCKPPKLMLTRSILTWMIPRNHC